MRGPAAGAARWVTGLLGAALFAGVAVFAASEWRLQRRWPAPPDVAASPPARTVANPEPLDRGRHLAEHVTLCGHCHAADLGGAAISESFWAGTLWAPNLTGGRGGLGASRTEADWIDALRRGVDPDDRTLVAMPADHLGALSAADLSAVLAYLAQVPPVDRITPPRRIGPAARLAILLERGSDVLAAERVTPTRSPPPMPEPAPSAAYGAYLARVGLCYLCHHADLSGGLHPLALPGEPSPADLRPAALAGWSEEDFRLAMRAGRTPDGRTLDPAWMPWPRYAGLSDLELTALWRFLRERRGP